MSPFLLLHDAFPQHIVQIMFFERLFEPFLSRGIDPLSDDLGSLPEEDAPSVGGYDCVLLLPYRNQGTSAAPLCHCTDMVRCRPTASSHNGCAHLHDLLKILRELFRRHIIISLAVPLLRKPGIWLHDDRQGGILQKLLQHREHLLRSHPAVDPQSVHPKTFQKCDHRRNVRSGEELSSLVEDRRSEHRKRRILLCRQHCRLQLIRIAHRLNVNQVRSRFFSADHDLFKCLICSLKVKISHGLEQFSRGTDIQRSVDWPFYSCGLCSSPHMSYCGSHDLFQGVPVVMKFERIGAEGISQDDIAPRLNVASVDLPDLIRVSQVPGLRKFSRFKAPLLEQCSHPSVKIQQFFSKSFSYHSVSFLVQNSLRLF